MHKNLCKLTNITRNVQAIGAIWSYLLLVQPKWVLKNRKGLEVGGRATKETERHSERSEKKNQNTVFSIAQTYAQFKLKTSKNHNGIINKKLSESKSTNLKGKTHLKFWPLWYGWRTSVRPVRPPVRGS